jgi:putative DNA primase/helicase
MSAQDKNKLTLSAEWYANQDWKILPCYGIVDGRCNCGQAHPEPKDVGKHPAINGWNKEATSDIAQVSAWWEHSPDQNIGVMCRSSGFFVIDIDPRHGGHNSYEKFEALVEGALPPTVEARTGAYNVGNEVLRGRHLFYKCDAYEDLLGNLNKLGLKGIDVKHNGYVLIAPSAHFSGTNYEWVEGKGPHEIEMAEAPEELLKALRKSNRTNSTSLGEMDWKKTFGAEVYSNGVKLDVDKILEDGIEEGERAVTIYALACSLANQFAVDTPAGEQALETLMIRFNHEKVRPPMALEGPNSLLMHTRRAIDFVVKNPKKDFLMEKYFPGATEWAESTAVVPATPVLGVVQPPIPTTNSSNPDVSIELSGRDPDSLENQEVGKNTGKPLRSMTDVGNGRRFIDHFRDVIRYTPGLGWFNWSSGYWKPDAEGLEIKELSKKIPVLVASELEDRIGDEEATLKWSQQGRSMARLQSALQAANSDPRISVDVDQWDKDDYLLGVMNGVVDLRTGDLLQNRPDLFITRRSPVGYIKGQKNVRWEEFLNFATGGDKEYQDWLQRAAGYSITGSRRYDILFIVYGPAGSGKNTFVEALVKCLGTKQYAWPLDTSLLMSSDGRAAAQDQYHWAELRGRRFAWIDELPDGERLKENSIKKLTGSSEISARSPGEKPFTFSSKAKVWISTNHRPIITDDAMWRRIRPMPFSFVPEVPDPNLKEYLFDPEGGLPAVLSWAVEGAIKVINSGSRDGLGWCRVVQEAAELYRKNEDRLQIFLSEETNEYVGANIPIKQLFTTYQYWSNERGERPMTQVAFQRKLSEKGINVTGSGGRAIVMDRALTPRPILTPPAPVEVDWANVTKFSREGN